MGRGIGSEQVPVSSHGSIENARASNVDDDAWGALLVGRCGLILRFMALASGACL